METIIAIGNPGTGKSTILNCLAEEVLFQSGIGYGGGVTQEIAIRVNKNGKFIDTPGFADARLREISGKAISEALKQDGDQKLLFFVTTQNGRVLAQDIATLKLVLNATPKIENDYGIVVNQVDPVWFEELTSDKDKMNEFKSYLFAGIDKHRQCSSVIFLPMKDQLTMKTNALIPLKELENGNFKQCITNVQEINLMSEQVGTIDINNFGTAVSSIEKLHEDMQKYNANSDSKSSRVSRAESESKSNKKSRKTTTFRRWINSIRSIKFFGGLQP